MSFLRNCWYMAYWSQDLRQGELLGRRILEVPLVFFRDDAGQPHALVDSCPHRFAPLRLGKLLPDGRIRCGYHGLEFDPSGTCVRNPHGSGSIPTNGKIRSFPLVERDTILWIWMGDQPADEALIPDFSILARSDPAVVSQREYMRMDANYMLINENLLDLSHAAVLHEGILGNEMMIPAKIDVTQSGRQICVDRWTPGVPAPALYDQFFNRDGGIVDIWTKQRFDVPGCFFNDTGATNPGRPREEGTGVYGTHFLTPETTATTHYHFAAVRQNPRSWGEPIDSELRQILSDLRRRAFEDEDKAIINAQQINFSDPSIDKGVAISLEVDVAPAKCRSLINRLIREETSTTRPDRQGA